jgi:surfactin synthase thioesterase subunit
MEPKWVVFGGWSLPPEMLKPLFGEQSIYIDVNHLFHQVINNDALIDRWPDRLLDAVMPLLPDNELRLAGWSTGSFFAYALAGLLQPSRLALLSGSLSFCNQGGYRFGQETSTLKIMRRQLKRDRISVLKDFQHQCGLSDYSPFAEKYSPEALFAGLVFLEHVDMSQFPKPLCTTHVFHGKEDAIIPFRAGEFLAKEIGAKIAILPGGHVFFMDEKVQETIKRKIFG